MLLCVTGPMASGKNAASAILEKRGFAAVDADTVAHTAIENAKPAILEAFGPLARERGIQLLNEDSSINRRALGSILFSDRALIARQEAIVYPEITRLLEAFIAEHAGGNVVINATVLYKVPLIQKMDSVLYIDAPSVIRFFRARRRDGLSCRNICARFKMQRHLFAKYREANADTRRVWNIGSREQLEKKIDRFLAASRLRG